MQIFFSVISLCMKLTSVVAVLGLLLAPFHVLAATESTSLSLDEAIGLALEQNCTLQAVQDRLTSVNISLEVARAAFGIKIRPEVSGLFRQADEMTQSYGVYLSKRLAQTGGDITWQTTTWKDDSLEEPYQTDVAIGYTQPLLKGRGPLPATAELEAAEHAVRSQYRALLLAEQQLILNVASAYFGIVRDQMLVEVNERALERAKTLLAAAQAKLKVGMASKMDVFRAELQVLTAENGLVDARESQEQAWRQLNLLLGLELERTFTLSTPLQYEPITSDSAQLVQTALDNRLELVEAYENVQEAERRVKLARQNLYPPLDLSVRYTLSGAGDAFDESLELKDNAWSVGINSAFDLDFASDRAAYQQAQLSYNGAVRAYEAAEQDVRLDVLQTLTQVNQAQARVYLQEQSVLQAEKQLELAELRYKKGLSDNLDVIDAEEALVKAKTSYYSAVVQHLLAKLRLQQAAGTLDVP